MQKYEFDNNRKMLNNFLEDVKIDDKYTTNKPFGYIYCIENKTSHKKYIGSVYSLISGNSKPIPYTQLRKRASNYLYEYNKICVNKSSAKQFCRPILLAMIDEGFDNFRMYPIAEMTRSTHSLLEKLFIDKFDTIKNGYNRNPAGANMHKIGTKLMAKDKLLRSEAIIAINPNRKQLIISDSMKLFADYVGTSKDIIKNSNRNARPYKGWFIFYIDNEKRHYILESVVINDENKREIHSEKAKLFYKELVSIIDLYLQDFVKENYFSDFTILPPLQYTD